MVLVTLVMFALIMAATTGYIARQSQQTVDQEQEEQAFGLADSGVQYTLWLLDNDGGAQTIGDLIALQSITRELRDENAVVIGTYVAYYSAQVTGNGLRVVAQGKDAQRPDVCQQVEATIAPFADGSHRVTGWNHHVSTGCDALGV